MHTCITYKSHNMLRIFDVYEDNRYEKTQYSSLVWSIIVQSVLPISAYNVLFFVYAE